MEMINELPFRIKYASFPGDLTAVTTLFNSYAEALGIDLSFQNFISELADLPGKYPVILLAIQDASQESIGCVALRPLPSVAVHNGSTSSKIIEEKKRICEMKRLYCSPAARGMGVGKALVKQIIKDAARLGFDEMRLDTLPSMEAARKMYESVGFVGIEAYYETPIEGTIFLGKDLRVERIVIV
ncbi:putative GNAT family acetyltransferase [Tricladium varicosporioides]|nr:putative GNAT family acetyltransferase [Hymenoscyphus varicosporioides]